MKKFTGNPSGGENDPRLDSLLESISLEDAIERDIGKRGTLEREEFEVQLKIELLGAEIKKIRNHKNMTQTDLGQKVGVSKYQISRIEADTTHVNIQTLLKVLNALGKELSFNII
jgi:HTH-type transcriptional regulator / antitoxin HipB